VFSTSGTYPWSLLTQIFNNGQPSHGGVHTTYQRGTNISSTFSQWQI